MTLLKFVTWAVTIMVVIGAGVSVWFMTMRPAVVMAPPIESATTTVAQVVSQAVYACDSNRVVDATFMESVTPAVPATAGMPPTPTGSVSLKFDTAAPVVLPQSLSADGSRYSSADEALVFWSKGESAIILDHGKAGTYTNCIVVKSNTSTLLPLVYHDGAVGFTLRYPAGFTVDSTFTYPNIGPKVTIPGVKFTIPTGMASGTNLSNDSYLSIEHLTVPVDSCTADAFMAPGISASLTTADVGGVTYSVASSSDAGAGNRYEETVFARGILDQCLAVRYFIHYGAIENYEPGAVQVFNREGLLNVFASIRDSVTFDPQFAETPVQ